MSRRDIDTSHQAWLNAMKENDAEALGRLVSEDAVLMPPNQPVVVGRAAVIDWFGGIVKEARTTGIVIPQREVIVTGDWAIERGSFAWTIAPTAGGAPIELQGSFLAIYQRQVDGTWKVTRNIWNSTLPVPAFA